eukprot:9785799-Heterocapsa_arctica.AAC.1
MLSFGWARRLAGAVGAQLPECSGCIHWAGLLRALQPRPWGRPGRQLGLGRERAAAGAPRSS